jgi:hypothetical protein
MGSVVLLSDLFRTLLRVERHGFTAGFRTPSRHRALR